MTELDILTRRDRAALQAAPNEEVYRAIRAVCDKSEGDEMDFDKLTSTAMFVASTGHESADVAVVDWFTECPTDERLDVACALLNGFWAGVSRKRAADPKLVARFVQARPATRQSADAENSYVQAMLRVVDDARTTENVQQIAIAAIREVLHRKTGNSTLDQHLASWVPGRIDAALARRAATVNARDFSGSQIDEDGRRYLAVERKKPKSLVIRVDALAVQNRTLHIGYEILDPTLSEAMAQTLIYQKILVELCKDCYRSQVSDVHYSLGGPERTAIRHYDVG